MEANGNDTEQSEADKLDRHANLSDRLPSVCFRFCVCVACGDGSDHDGADHLQQKCDYRVS
jgi:hypothetical protein